LGKKHAPDVQLNPKKERVFVNTILEYPLLAIVSISNRNVKSLGKIINIIFLASAAHGLHILVVFTRNACECINAERHGEERF